MNIKKPAFTLLELLISAGLLAGLSVLLLSSLSGLIGSYELSNNSAKANVQGQLAMRQMQDLIEASTDYRILKTIDAADAQLLLTVPSRDVNGNSIVNQNDLLFYCLPAGKGVLKLYRAYGLTSPSILTGNNLPQTQLSCDNPILKSFNTSVTTPPSWLPLTDTDIRVIAFDAREVSIYKTTLSKTPALKIILVTRYDPVNGGGILRAGEAFGNFPSQLQSKTYFVKNMSQGYPTSIMSGT